ncbi:MAG: radical SAM protein [Armatimonadota bacterium]|nr:radical SAM protein [bacterium]
MKQPVDVVPPVTEHANCPVAEEHDSPVRPTYLRLSVTDNCNQCCIYCRPANCSTRQIPPLSLGDIRSIVNILARAGIEKVRITGGEPLMREDLPEIAHVIASAPGIRSVGLTTNGVNLARCAHQLRQVGVTNINISLDSLDSVMTNTVVMRGINDGEVPVIAALSRDLPIETRFIELMPLDGSALDWNTFFVPAQEIRDLLGELVPVPLTGISTAKTYQIPGAKGCVGIIAPMTEPFCRMCNRIRLTCAGSLKPCLRLSATYDMLHIARDPRADDVIAALLEHSQVMKQRTSSQTEASLPVISMFSIGG